MTRKVRDRLLLAGKLLLAAALLAWVISKVHWRDYVVDDQGRSYSVLSVSPAQGAPEEITVAEGPWAVGGPEVRSADEFVKPFEGAETPVYEGFASSLRRTNPWVLGASVVGFLAAFLTMAFRWWSLIRLQDIRVGLWEAVRLTFLGLFYNMVIPGTVGGDVAKAYYISKHTPGRPAPALLSIFTDRVMGLSGLTLMAATMLAVVLLGGLATFDEVRMPTLTVLVLLVVVALAVLFLLSRRFRGALHLHKLYSKLPIAHHIEAAGDAARVYRHRLGGLARTVAITAVSQTLFVGSIALTGVSLSLDVHWYEYLAYIPLVYILGAVPLTPGGVGLVEAFFVQFFRSPSVNPSEILAMALLARLIPVFWGLPGAVVAVTGAKLPRTAAMESELGLTGDETRSDSD
ncbi:MAG: lysylphosphatidylglycerol synthase transmembrane domain-containing protein [Planctomycetota bacterium]